ncbi:uncharacterized protein LOC107269859 [Cephus cinctus]|uniref:Uncharacterized protein LOC107269859 n=1 Tax=Cephus cinctus TaxID=211228 RepID=A0AAJ7RLE5_CEPCN|nr:uncharacterized protein LOC107269859 [Cephus cinctus]
MTTVTANRKTGKTVTELYHIFSIHYNVKHVTRISYQRVGSSFDTGDWFTRGVDDSSLAIFALRVFSDPAAPNEAKGSCLNYRKQLTKGLSEKLRQLVNSTATRQRG